MTPQERDLIAQLLGRLGQVGGQPKDPEADGLIRQAVAAQPDAPYYLVQTVLIQDIALSSAQSRIHALEQQLAAAQPAPAKPAAAQPTSFLGGLLGGGGAQAGGSVPASGPWSRPAPGPAAPQPQYQPQPQYLGQPQYQGQPMMGGMPMMGQSMFGGGSGFLRSAATTAAGIAGGALLFQGIQSMFGAHAGGILSGTSMQPGLSETVVNNYYGSDQAGGGAPETTAWDQPAGGDPAAADYADAADNGADNAADPGQDFASDQDFGGGDFGGDSDTV
jgi:uncharacterized protein